MSTLDQILSFLQGQLGLTPAQAAGVAGNFQVESGFNPAAYNPSEHAVGLAQWEGGRELNLRQFAQQRGTSENDLSTQLAFLQAELSGPEAGAFTRLKQTTTPADAASVFDQYFERSAGTSRAQRIADAQAIANGSPTTTGPASSGSDSGSDSSSSSSPSSGSTASQMGSLQGGIFTIAVKVVAGAAAAALVVIGALHTVEN